MKKRNILILAILFMAIGFATVATNLIINGITSIGKNTEDFDVYFSKTIENGVENSSLIKDKTHIEYTANLMEKDDTYVLKYEVTNASQNYNLNITLDITEENEYLTITNEFLDEPLLARTSREGTLTIKLKKPTIEAKTFTVKVDINVDAAERTNLGTGDVPPMVNNAIKVLSGDGTHVGDEIAIGEEHFYVIENNGESIQMLAKYNLYVGNSFNGISATPYGDEATGIQDSSMKGATTETPYEGVITFSEREYWSNYGVLFPAYVYDENSNIYEHIENYVGYLNENYNIAATGKLINKEKLNELGCDDDNNSCTSAPEWIYTTSYWSGTVTSLRNYGDFLWYVESNGDFSSQYGNYGDKFGVRPVITISASLI